MLRWWMEMQMSVKWLSHQSRISLILSYCSIDQCHPRIPLFSGCRWPPARMPSIIPARQTLWVSPRHMLFILCFMIFFGSSNSNIVPAEMLTVMVNKEIANLEQNKHQSELVSNNGGFFHTKFIHSPSTFTYMICWKHTCHLCFHFTFLVSGTIF